MTQTRTIEGQLIYTPHPVVLDGQVTKPCLLHAGESLATFLERSVDTSAPLEVRIGGRVVPEGIWHLVKPKDGQIIEVRGSVHENALYIIAMLVLTYFTFGIGTAGGAAAGAFGGGVAGAVFASAVYVAGAALGGRASA